MLFFDQFTATPVAVTPDTVIGAGVKLVFDQSARMRCGLRRSQWRDPTGQNRPTLVIAGERRAPDDWLGLEIALPPTAGAVTLTCRNYPAHRLFPRLHFDVLGRIEHLDLAHVAASDVFATRRFDAAEWQEQPIFRDGAPDGVRLTILVPSSPWFAMEIQTIEIENGGDHA